MIEINFKYHGGHEETVNLTESRAKEELMAFLNRFSEAGKKQWMSRVKKRDYPPPLNEDHFDQFAKRFLEKK